MTRGISYLLSCLVSIIVIIFLMKVLGISMADVEEFLRVGIGGALELFRMFQQALQNPFQF